MEEFVLTLEQQRLAGENHNLIYRFAQQKGADVEEVYGILAIALCKAAKAYDVSRGTKFSSLAFQCMNNEYNLYLRHENNLSHFPPGSVFSYNSMIPNSANKDSTEYLSIIINKDNSHIIDTGELEVDEFVKSLKPVQQKVLIGLMCGRNMAEIARRLGCSRQYIFRVRDSIGQRWISEQ